MDFFSNTKKIIAVGVAVILISGTSFFIGVSVGSEYGDNFTGDGLSSRTDSLQPAGVDFSPLWETWHILDTKFVPTSTSTVITNEEKLWSTIQGLTKSTKDPYTVFFPPADAEIFEDDISGNFEGVGMEIGIRDGLLTVIAPLKGTPAERAGIKSGDIIVKMDGVFNEDITVDAAVKKIRGEGGTPIVFTIAREGESDFIEIKVIRDVIQIPTISTELRSDNVFVIELYNFSANSPVVFANALREFTNSGSHKLILDLRGNPGGYLEASVDMASWFLPAGEVILSEDFGKSEKPQIYRSKGYDVFNDSLRMAILIDRGSASASEILAGALQEHGVAKLVGEKSYGKGSVQELIKITPETSLKVTIARWLTPNGTSISDGGLTPDYEVEITEDDFDEGRDPQLEKAIEILAQ